MLLLTDLVDLIPAGLESEYCSYTDAQSGFHADLLSWCDRVSVDPSAHQYVAFGLWGDAAPYTNKDSLYLLVGSILSGEHRDRWWLSAIAKRRICNCGCKGRHTFERLFEVLVWQFKCLLRGKHPSVTHDNKPFEFGSARRKKAGRDLRVRGCLLRKQGDWSWLKQCLGLTGWRGEGEDCRICYRCPAQVDGRFPAYDFSSSASWRRNLFSTSDWWAHARGARVFVSALRGTSRAL